MKLQYIFPPLILLFSSQIFANYEQIISNYKVETVKSFTEFNSRLAKLEDASFRADQNRAKAYYMRGRDPMGFNNAVCNALSYSTALYKFTSLNPLFTSQDTRNSVGNSLFTNAAYGQNARCPQSVDKIVPASKLGTDFYKKNISEESLTFLANYDQRRKSTSEEVNSSQNIILACETVHNFSNFTKLYLNNYEKLGQKDLLSFQSIEKERQKAIVILQKNNIESACMSGNIKDEIQSRQNAELEKAQRNTAIQNTVPDTSSDQKRISNEKIACGVTNALFKALSKDSSYKSNCN